MSKRKPLNLAEAAKRYADSVVKRMSSADAPLADIRLELCMAYMAGALRDVKPKETAP